MQPKKKDIEQFKASPDEARVNRLVSATYLLMNLAKTYIDDAEDICKEYNLTVGELRRDLNNTNLHYERYASRIRTMLNHGQKEQAMHFLKDYEELEKMVTGYLKVHEEG